MVPVKNILGELLISSPKNNFHSTACIRNILSFIRYEKRLDDAKNYGIKKSISNGLLLGVVWLVINGAYALGFW